MKANPSALAGEQQLALFLENCAHAVAMLDRELRYVHVTKGWRDLYRLGDRELVGLRHDELVAVPPSWIEQYQSCLNGAEVFIEDDHLPGDGEPRFVRRSLRPWRDIDGEIGGVIIEKVPITEEKRALKA